jgi:UDP-N-acetylmuramate--alanine ligase
MRNVYFIGIGGIGMSALAQYLADKGERVSGSDRGENPVTDLLKQKGIQVTIGQRAENVSRDADVIVYSDAVSEDNPERARAVELSIPQISYFQMLGQLSGSMRTVAVAGTHGKTTTTGMLAKILQKADMKPTAIIGSIVNDFKSNYLSGSNELFVVEACEYRNHVLELTSEILVITNLEWDHTDFFPSLAALQETFRQAVEKVPANGTIVTDTTHPNIEPLLENVRARVIDYTREPPYELLLPGEFNQMNARAAASAARAVSPSISTSVIAAALKSFHGTWRRFEYKGKTKNGTEVYDDYAHHPTAIKETLRALRTKTKAKIYVAFQPHLFSRTHDLLDGFARAFSDADEILIAPIYAAREVDDGTISNKIVADRICAEGKNSRATTFTEIEHILNTEPLANDTIMTMGAGDIYKIADTIAVKQ